MPVQLPEYSASLAEFIGILLGDGCINYKQITISLNSRDDAEYVGSVVLLIEKLFKYKPSITLSKKKNVLIIRISRINIVNYLLSIGMRTGNKVHQQIEVPSWIRDNIEYSNRCIRGLIDTDGCMYVDKHIIRTKLYMNLGLNFTNRSIPLLDFVKEMLHFQGYHPRHTTHFSIFMRKEKEIVRYMQEIGSSNPKIINKFKNFFENK